MLKQKNILITGATSGIGLACAEQAAKQGVNLILLGRRKEKLAQLCESLEKRFNIKCVFIAADIRDLEAIKIGVNQLPENFSQIDVLINNAGLAKGLDKLQNGDIEHWEQMIDTNIKGLLYISRLVIPNMVARNQGHVINISSISGHEVYPNGAVYCGTKHAVDAITRGLRLDLMGTAIRVTAISPGLVETEFSLVRFEQDAEKAKKTYTGMQPLTPENIAESVLFAIQQPAHVNINEIILTPIAQAGISHVHRT